MYLISSYDKTDFWAKQLADAQTDKMSAKSVIFMFNLRTSYSFGLNTMLFHSKNM